MAWRTRTMKLRSQAALEYGLVLGFAVLIAVVVMLIAVSIAVHGGRLVMNETEAVVEELEEMRTCLTG